MVIVCVESHMEGDGGITILNRHYLYELVPQISS